MKCVEKEEDRVGIEEPQKQVFHLCIVNLVIGTLYCAKGNYPARRRKPDCCASVFIAALLPERGSFLEAAASR